MLRITFTPPDGGDPKTFTMDSATDGMSAAEAELIEDAGGRQWGTFMEWAMALMSGSFRAIRVLLWIHLRREQKDLALVSLDFPVDSLVFETVDDEPAPEPEGKDVPGDSDTSSP